MSFQHSDFKYIDTHVHIFPPEIFKAIWNFFEMKDETGKVRGWPVNYKLTTEELVKFLESQNIEYFTTLNYAHKKDVADYINDWIYEFSQKYKKSIPFGCLWLEDPNYYEYIKKAFTEYDFYGIKLQPLVQKFHLYDERLDIIYRLLLEENKWVILHAGTAPYRNKFVGYKNFIKFIEKYPNINVIVAHMGAFEYKKFFSLLDSYENLYLDTTMIFIPQNIFPERKSTQPSIEHLISYQDRLLFGTDFPNIPYDYRFSTQGLLEFDLERKFYENIFYNNAKRVFQL